MKRLSVIGIGAGDPDHLTMQAVKALNQVDALVAQLQRALQLTRTPEPA